VNGARLHTERIHGALLGTACGDALGAPFEGAATVDPAELSEWMGTARPLRYTDDTAMLIALGEYLLELGTGRSIDEEELLREFARHWRREPWRGYGAGPPRIFELVEGGMPWRDAASGMFPGGSFGNGGAMRVAPIPLLATDLHSVVTMARASASVTHLHAIGVDGAVAQAAAVWWALHSPPDQPLDTERFLDRVAGVVETAELRDKLSALRDLLSGVTPEQAADGLGNGIAAQDSVPTALLAFLRHPDSVVGAITFAIQVGGDTDTIAAMTGAITGARNGVQAIPPAWLVRLENLSDLRALADRFAERFNREATR